MKTSIQIVKCVRGMLLKQHALWSSEDQQFNFTMIKMHFQENATEVYLNPY